MYKMILDGTEYELSKELVEKITREITAQKNEQYSFEREEGVQYFYIDTHGDLTPAKERYFSFDDKCFRVANYCRDRKKLKQRSLHEILNRMLWRYSEKHGGDPKWMLGKYPANVYHYEIVFAPGRNDFLVTSAINAKTGGIYFKDASTAESAIEEVVKPFMVEHPEFEW